MSTNWKCEIYLKIVRKPKKKKEKKNEGRKKFLLKKQADPCDQ